jgi:hypothetical protein
MLALILWVSILINEVLPAPSSGPEWVELYNTSDSAVDVSGWRIDDDTPGGTQTTIPAGSIIAPRAVLAVAITTAILNNTGDSVVLLDASGAQVDRIDFGAMKSNESMARIPDGATFIIKGTASIGTLNATATTIATTVPSATATATTIPDDTPTAIPSDTATAIPSDTPITIPDDTPTPILSDTSTPSPTKTPSLTQTPSETNTPSVTKTPPATTTGSPSKTASTTRTPSMTKTPSVTRTPSITKTISVTKITSPSKTISPSKTPSETRTTSPSKTPSETRTASRTKGNVRISITPTTVLMRMRISKRTPALVLCAPQGQSLADWTLKSHDVTKVITSSQTGCQTMQWRSANGQIVTLYNPYGVQMATIDMAQTACQLDLSTCQPSATATAAASPVLVWDTVNVEVVQATPTRMHEDIVYKGSVADFPDGAVEPLPPPPIHDGAPQGVFFMIGVICLIIGGGTQLWLARTPTPVLYSQPSDEAESSDQRVSSESRSV